MSRIYVTVHHVIVYTGERTAQTDLLFDYLNALDKADLKIPSIGKFDGVGEAGLDVLTGMPRIWNWLGITRVWMNKIATQFGRFWRLAEGRFSSMLRKSNPDQKIVLSVLELNQLVSDYFLR